MFVRLLTLKVVEEPTQTGEGEALRAPKVGQTAQLPGPTKVTLEVVLQPLLLVMVTTGSGLATMAWVAVAEQPLASVNV